MMDPSDETSFPYDEVLCLYDDNKSHNPQVDNDHISINGQSMELTLNSSSSLPQKRPKGRRKIEFTKILEPLCCRNSSRKPKKEYIVTSLIRGIKKGFRSMAKGYSPKKLCFAIDVSSESEMKIWEAVRKIYVADSDFIDEIARTENGPFVDGKGKAKSIKNSHKTYTNAYCKEFFSIGSMQEAFRKLIELIFLDFKCSHSMSNLCKECYDSYCNRCCSRLNFNCCSNGKNSFHSSICVKKWDNLREYFHEKFFEELKVQVLPVKHSTSDGNFKFN